MEFLKMVTKSKEDPLENALKRIADLESAQASMAEHIAALQKKLLPDAAGHSLVQPRIGTPGGRYLVDGKLVDANGNEVREL
jgi:hypothetical protein